MVSAGKEQQAAALFESDDDADLGIGSDDDFAGKEFSDMSDDDDEEEEGESDEGERCLHKSESLRLLSAV